MEISKILSAETGLPSSFFYLFSVRENYGFITAVIADREGTAAVLKLTDSGIKEQISIYTLSQLRGISLSADGTGLFCIGGRGSRSSTYYNLADGGTVPINQTDTKEMIEICSYNPVPGTDLLARAQWDSPDRMIIQFLSQDEETGLYVPVPSVPELTSEYLISSIVWSPDGKRIIITSGDVDDGYKGTNGTAEIYEYDRSGSKKWECLYGNVFSQIIGNGCFSENGSIAAYNFDDKIRFIDTSKGTVLSTKRKTLINDMAFYNSAGKDYLWYTRYSTVSCINLKNLKECFHLDFTEKIVNIKILSDDRLLCLFQSGEFALYKIYPDRV